MHKTILRDDWSRARAKALIDRAPDGFVATLAEPKRTNAQNDRFYAMLTDISDEIESEVEGVIADILVENGQTVEYGEPLFKIKQP